MGFKKTKRKTDDCYALDTQGICARYDIGVTTARELGEAAGARVKLGKKLLFLVGRIDEYLEKLADEQNEIKED